MMNKTLAIPFAVVAYLYVPVIVVVLKYALGFEPVLSASGVMLSWLISLMLVLAYAEMRFIASA